MPNGYTNYNQLEMAINLGLTEQNTLKTSTIPKLKMDLGFEVTKATGGLKAHENHLASKL